MMKALKEVIDILLSVPVFVTLTRIAGIAIIAQFLEVFVFDMQHLHQTLVVIQARYITCIALNL